MLTFTGSLMDGPDFDAIKFSGLELSDDELERLWEEVHPLTLIRECTSVLELDTGEIDEIPGQSDAYFEYRVEDPEAFRKELREAILSVLSSR